VSIRLLNVVPTLLCGGTENQVMTLARALDPGRFTLDFAVLRRWGPFVSEITDRQIPLTEYRISSFKSLGAFTEQAKLARYIVRNGVDIVHGYNFYGNVFAVPPARIAGAPVVIASVRDRGPYLTPMQKRVQRHVCRLADCVLVNADAVKDWLVGDGYNPKTIAVIRNGVDLTRFEQRGDTAGLRSELGIPAGAPTVMVLSRLNRLKGIEEFLRACALVAREFPAARFLVVGEPSPVWDRAYLTTLSDLAQQLGIADRVLFTGLRSDVPALLALTDVAVMPSLNEALSNVLLESMAAGAAVVATDVGGTKEALTHERTGLLVPPGDPHAMAASMARLLRDRELASRLGHAARRHIVEHFSLDGMVRATERLYLDLLARKHGKKAITLPRRHSHRAERGTT
jgi:glycosyltransferase involved in cell wall biosynthesis